VTLGINYETFHKILKVNKSPLVTLSTDEDADKLFIDMSMGNTCTNFEMNLMDLQVEGLTIHDLDFSCSVQMNSAEFLSIIGDLSNFGNDCIINCTSDKLSFEVIGELANGKVVKDDLNVECKEDTKLTFAFKHLLMIAGSKLSDTVSIKFGYNIPLCIEYPINDGNILFFLAPKIADEVGEE
jgi:proliferating cell nuclear antigen PCNA